MREPDAGDRIQTLAILGTLVPETADELNRVLRSVIESIDLALLSVKERNYSELREAIRDASEGVRQLAELARVLRQDDVAHGQPALLDVLKRVVD